MPGHPEQHVQRTVIGHASVVGRQALRMVLEAEDDLSVDGEASDAAAAGALAREISPDFLILQDLLLTRGFTGPLPPLTMLVVLGMDLDPMAASAAVAHGAAGYVCLDRADLDLVVALHELHLARLS